MRALLVALAVGALAAVALAPQSLGHSSLRACTARDLRALGGRLQGATGSMVGMVSFRNVSSTACALGGRPEVQIAAPGAKLLPTRERALTRAAVGGNPVDAVGAGRRTALFLQWSNWCGAWPARSDGFRPLYLRVKLTTGARLSAPFRSGRPRCDVHARSTLGVSLFSSSPG